MESGASFRQGPVYQSPEPRETAMPAATRPGSGWIAFAGAYLLIAGGMNVIWGIVALANKDAFREGGLVWSNLNTWGWITIVVGGIQLLAGFLVLAQRFSGQWLAGTLAVLGIFVSFFALGAYPVWSVLAMVCNGLVLWAVTAHGDEFA